MFDRRRLRRVVAAVTAMLLQCTTVASASTSVIWCIGDDGHAGIERRHAGSDCDACCPGEESEAAGLHAAEGCTDVALLSASAVPSKVAPGLDVVFVASGFASIRTRTVAVPAAAPPSPVPDARYRQTVVLRI